MGHFQNMSKFLSVKNKGNQMKTAASTEMETKQCTAHHYTYYNLFLDTLLLLRSQLYFRSLPILVRFLHMNVLEVVTFHLPGWCMLGMLLLPAFTCPGYECKDLLSRCNGMHVCTD